MIQQTVFPFKLERTDQEITSRSGLALYAEFMKALGIEEWVNRYLPGPGSGRGYQALTYIRPLSIILYGGGISIEDVRELREDKALRKITGLKVVPSSSGIGDWLKRMGKKGGIEGMVRVNDQITRKVIRADKRKEYTLMADPFIIEADKDEAKMTYLGFKGYRPVVVTLKELGIVLAYKFREGNESGDRVEILKAAFKRMPKGKRIKLVLLDSEYYNNEVIEFLNEQKVYWAIAADKDSSIREAIKEMPAGNWRPLRTEEGVLTDREIASTVHVTNRGKMAFKIVVIRWQDSQPELFRKLYNYHVIATNLDVDDEKVVWEYNDRAYVENHIKELKGGFGMEGVPCGDFGANSMYFAIGVMTYNLWIAQKLLILPEEWWNKTIHTMRWVLIEIAGKVIEHGRRLVLKVAASLQKYKLYLFMRDRCIELLT